MAKLLLTIFLAAELALSVSPIHATGDDWERKKAFMRCGVKTMKTFKMGLEVWRDESAMRFQQFCMGSAGYKFDHSCARPDYVHCYH